MRAGTTFSGRFTTFSRKGESLPSEQNLEQQTAEREESMKGCFLMSRGKKGGGGKRKELRRGKIEERFLSLIPRKNQRCGVSFNKTFFYWDLRASGKRSPQFRIAPPCPLRQRILNEREGKMDGEGEGFRKRSFFKKTTRCL